MNLWGIFVFVLFDPRPDIVIIAVTILLSTGAGVAALLDWAIARTAHRR